MEPGSQKEEVRQKVHSSKMGRPRLTSLQNHALPITGCGLTGKYPPPAPSLLPRDYLYLTGEKLNKQTKYINFKVLSRVILMRLLFA